MNIKSILLKINLLTLLLIVVSILNSCEFERLNILSEIEVVPISATVIQVRAKLIDFEGSISDHGFVWSEFSTPEVFRPGSSQINLNELSGRAEFSANITGLEPNTTYFIRAFAIPDGRIEDVFYGRQQTVVTNASLKPEEFINVKAVNNVKTTTATVEGTIESLGATSEARVYGHCYATSPNPTVNDLVVQVENQNVSNAPFTYFSELTELTPNTKYYVRAFMVTTISEPDTVYSSFETDFITTQ